MRAEERTPVEVKSWEQGECGGKNKAGGNKGPLEQMLCGGGWEGK